MKCEYGCEQEAKYSPQKGRPRWCCSKNYRSCPSNKKKYGGNNGALGKKHTEERKRNISHSLKGRKVWNKDLKDIYSIETIQKMKNSGGKHLLGKTYEDLYSNEKLERLKNESSKRMKVIMKGRKPWNTGLKTGPLSIEHKKKIRIAAIKRTEFKFGQLYPNYNPEACKLIDEYGKKYGYKFQHAENGGEFHIKELGYWVDGYDKNKNIVIEIDEKHHFNINGKLKEKDIERQKEIEKFLKCKFIRIEI